MLKFPLPYFYCLSEESMKPDKSPKGSIDEDIIPLLNVLNTRFETTSSCSGRITLMKGLLKSEAEWIFKSHNEVDANELYEAIQNYFKNNKDEQTLRFLFEPLIIHVKCFNLEKAEALLNLLHNNGFKKSSLKYIKDFIVEIAEAGRMETLITKELSKQYINILVNEANRRLRCSKTNIKRLEIICKF